MLLSVIKNLFKNIFKTTRKHTDYWVKRKADWNATYLSTADHPHRNALMHVLSLFPWTSLFEVGCGPGANLKKICQSFKDKQIGGCDVNSDAIDLAKKVFKGAILKVGPAKDIMMSDNSVDVVLADMTLMYVGPREIEKTIKEMKRVTRRYVLLCELTSSSWWEQLKLFLKEGYHCHQYRKLLAKSGFFDIIEWKLNKDLWPGGGLQEKYGKVILAKKINKR